MRNADDSESENDGDEEAALTGNAQNGLSIEYKGSTSTLRTPADIAAWIAERKRKYPTAAKRETARREAEEKRKKFEAQRKARQEAVQAARVKGHKEHPGKGHQRPILVDRVDRDAGSQSTKHTKMSAKSQTSRDPAGNALEAAATLGAHGGQRRERKGDRLGTAVLDSNSDSPFSSDSNATSSCGSDTDEDTAPDISSSKTETDPIAAEQTTKERQVCQFFAKHGHCKWGSRCKHRHENVKATRAPKGKTGPVSTKRKGLWQVMVEKEQEEESKKVLHAIVALGKQGLLDEPT